MTSRCRMRTSCSFAQRPPISANRPVMNPLVTMANPAPLALSPVPTWSTSEVIPNPNTNRMVPCATTVTVLRMTPPRSKGTSWLPREGSCCPFESCKICSPLSMFSLLRYAQHMRLRCLVSWPPCRLSAKSGPVCPQKRGETMQRRLLASHFVFKWQPAMNSSVIERLNGPRIGPRLASAAGVMPVTARWYVHR
jgi:hypothetical protein